MRADRLLQLMLLLQMRGKLTTEELAAELEVSRRTILRDIDALSVAGIPIYTDSGHGGGVSLDEKYRVKLNGLNETEVQALILSNNTSLLADIGYDNAAEVSLLKLLSALPSIHEQAAKTMQNRILIDPIAWWRHDYAQTYLNDLKQAVFEQRFVYMQYQKHDGNTSERQVAPYGLVAKGSIWYLIAAGKGDYRSYRVSRIRAMRLLEETFQRDEQFNLESHWQESVTAFVSNFPAYRFTLRIPEEKLRFVEWYTPGSYTIEQRADNGWFVAQFEVETIDIALMLIFGLGKKTEVIDPPDLREVYARRLEEMSNNNLPKL